MQEVTGRAPVPLLEKGLILQKKKGGRAEVYAPLRCRATRGSASVSLDGRSVGPLISRSGIDPALTAAVAPAVDAARLLATPP